MRRKEVRALPTATRREARKEIRVQIRIFGTDYENVFTVNASRAGAMVIEVRTRLKVGEIIGPGLRYGLRSGRAQSVAISAQNLAGLESVRPEDIVRDFPCMGFPFAGPRDRGHRRRQKFQPAPQESAAEVQFIGGVPPGQRCQPRSRDGWLTSASGDALSRCPAP